MPSLFRAGFILGFEKQGEKTTMKRSFLRLMLVVLAFPALSGCGYVAAAGAGAAVTYYAVENGYKAQSPVTHEISNKQQHKE
jgi:hypothetical protein